MTVPGRWAALLILLLLALSLAGPSIAQDGALDAELREDFSRISDGTHLELQTEAGTFRAPDRNLRVLAADAVEPGGEKVLRLAPLRGAQGPLEISLDLPRVAAVGEVLELDLRRAARGKGFAFRLEFLARGEARMALDLTHRVPFGSFERITLELPEAVDRVLFHVESKAGSGVELGQVLLHAPLPMELSAIDLRSISQPLVAGMLRPVGEVTLETRGALQPLSLQSARIDVSVPGHRVVGVEFGGLEASPPEDSADDAWRLSNVDILLHPGRSTLPIHLRLEVGPEGSRKSAPLKLGCTLQISGAETVLEPVGTPPRTAAGIRTPGTRTVEALALTSIPTRPKQPLVPLGAAQLGVGEEASIVLLRPTADGSMAAAPFPHASLAGCVSPCLLVERVKRRVRLYVQRVSDGALLESVSEDAGSTWSEPAVCAIDGAPLDGAALQPGRGVAMSTGGWALPALQRQPDGPVAPLLLTSRNRGRSFEVSSSALHAMGSCCIVELGDGALLVDGGLRGRGRRDLISTLDLGETWRDGLSRRRPLLPCSGSGAALIHVGRELYGISDWRLLFVNPATSGRRPSRLMIRGSNDNGDNWFETCQLLVDEGVGCGPAGLAIVDEETVLTIYRSSGAGLVAQWIPLADVVQPVQSIFDVFGANSPLGR